MKLKNRRPTSDALFLTMIVLSVLFNVQESLAREVRCDSVFTQSLEKKRNSLEKIVETSGRSVVQRENRILTFHHHFAVSRDIKGYSDYQFGLGFRESIVRLSPNDVIFDGGCGDAVLSDHLNTPMAPKYVGVTFELINRTQDYFREREIQGRLKIFTGRFFEDITDSELKIFGKFKIITDLYGIMSYAKEPDVVLQRYFDLLAENGEIYIFGPQMKLRGGHSFGDWLRQIQGIHVETITGTLSTGSQGPAYRLQKINQQVKIPKLIYEDKFKSALPPIRYYSYSGEYLISE